MNNKGTLLQKKGARFFHVNRFYGNSSEAVGELVGGFLCSYKTRALRAPTDATTHAAAATSESELRCCDTNLHQKIIKKEKGRG